MYGLFVHVGLGKHLCRFPEGLLFLVVVLAYVYGVEHK